MSSRAILYSNKCLWDEAKHATPSPYLVAHCAIDNSRSMNGKKRRGNSRADICPCMHRGHRDNDRLPFDLLPTDESLYYY